MGRLERRRGASCGGDGAVGLGSGRSEIGGCDSGIGGCSIDGGVKMELG